MGKLPPPEDGCQAEVEELPTYKDGLENIGRIRRIRHDPMLSLLPVRSFRRPDGLTRWVAILTHRDERNLA
ncbi:MAG: hypothetical protein WD810_06460 [Solirubrobacterales bacterium]